MPKQKGSPGAGPPLWAMIVVGIFLAATVVGYFFK